MRSIIAAGIILGGLCLARAEAVKTEAPALSDSTVDYKIKKLQTKIGQDSLDIPSQFKLGVYYYRYKYWFPKAIRQWQDVLEQDTSNGQAHFYLAWVYYSKLYDMVRAEYHALVAIDLGRKTNTQGKYWYKMAHWVLAGIYQEQGDEETAARLKEQWLDFYRPPQPKQVPLPVLREEIARLRMELGIDEKPEVSEKKEEGQVKL